MQFVREGETTVEDKTPGNISTWFTPRTKDFCRYQVQASRFMAQVIVLVIINAMIENWDKGSY